MAVTIAVIEPGRFGRFTARSCPDEHGDAGHDVTVALVSPGIAAGAPEPAAACAIGVA